MSTATSTALLTITSGPDRGKTFPLTEEFVHIGRADDCQLILSDNQVEEVHASLANRNGRYAIITAYDRSVEVDGRPLPAEQWAWLPAQATIKLTPKTTLQFTGGVSSAAGATNGEAGELVPPTTVPIKAKAGDKRKLVGKKGESPGRTVARFLTERPGEMLVRLGDDGHLPELSLAETAAPKVDPRKRASQGNPALIYGALGFSLLSSLAMLFIDLPSGDAKSLSKTEARRAILREFVGDDKTPLKPYQQLLRNAGLAHSRGDYAAERAAYKQVLALLNSEDKNPFMGITGTVQNDERDETLRKHLAVLLAR